jgi:acylphosphatase
MSTRRLRILVRGLVQGVAYRASTRYEAQRLGLTGWVKNQPDGSVLLEAQGERVPELEKWCRRGPPAAEVTGIEVEELDVVEGERGFAVTF